MAEHLKDQAAVALGRKGGSKKIPKGFSMKTEKERAAAGTKGMAKRWGKEVKLEMYVTYFPRNEQKIIEAGRASIADVEPIDSDREEEEVYDVQGAACDICLKALMEAGFVGGLFKRGMQPRTTKTFGTEEEWYSRVAK